MQTLTPEAFGLGGLYITSYRVSYEFVDGHTKVVVSGTVGWKGVALPFTYPIWVRVYYKGNVMDEWRTWYDPFQPAPYYFTVDKVYDVPKGDKIKIVAGFSYLTWEFETDEKEVVIDYFSPYVKSCTFDLVSPCVGVLRIVLGSAMAPDVDRTVTLVIGRGLAPCKKEDSVWCKDLVWPAGESEIVVELTCSREALPEYVYLPESEYWACVIYEGQPYGYRFFVIRYEYKTFWQRVVEWVYRHKYELLGLALVLVLMGAIMARRRRSS